MIINDNNDDINDVNNDNYSPLTTLDTVNAISSDTRLLLLKFSLSTNSTINHDNNND